MLEEIIVCMKMIPRTAEVPVRLSPSGKDIERGDLALDTGEADDCALEEALRLKERFGGKVTVITAGPPEADEILRTGLAKGADHAVRIDDRREGIADPAITARLLSEAIKRRSFDLILTGCMAEDDNFALAGQLIAAFLDIPCAVLVSRLELDPERRIVRCRSDWEEGICAVFELPLPALLTVQTGINEPRYASLRGIREALRRKIEIMPFPQELKGAPSLEVLSMFLPLSEKRGLILKGDPKDLSRKLFDILRDRGFL